MKAGILGGGQLGRMLLQAAANYPVETYVLEDDPDCPAAHLCHHFTKGDIRDFETVYAFGKQVDVLTIEIESVNVDALAKLESEGVRVVPNSAAIATIKNKILQKEFYLKHKIHTPAFVVTQNKHELQQHVAFLPAVHKLATGGYDGRGVQVIKREADIQQAFDEPSVLEKLVSIVKEIAIMVAVDDRGKTAVYPAVEMFFDAALNQLSFQLCPAQLDLHTKWKAEAYAIEVVKNLQSPGVFAVEMFVDKDNEVWVNETAPRVHNSGHHTIEAHYSSQFDMLWRIMLGYPLGNTASLSPSAMVNITGAEGHTGKAVYNGLAEALKLENTFVHIYGKHTTKPGRKMGHLTILDNDAKSLITTAKRIKKLLRVEAEEKEN